MAQQATAPAPGVVMDHQLLRATFSNDTQLLARLLDMPEDAGAAARDAQVFAIKVDEHLRPRSAASLLAGVTSDGDSALHVAATCGHLKSAEVIFDRASYLLYAGNNNGDTPLHCAVRARDHKMVSCLIALARGNGGVGGGDQRSKAILRMQNRHGETALHEAVRSGNPDLVAKLLEEDYQLARVPGKGTSPLYLAVFLLHHDIVEKLLDQDEELSYSGPDGQNALHAAVLRSVGITKKLLGRKKDLTEHVDHNGNTPLHVAASWRLTKLPDISSPVVPLLVEANKSSPYQPDKYGSFAIHIAAAAGELQTLKYLLEKCAKCASLRDSKGMTFLHVAAKKRRREVVSYACEKEKLSPSVLNMQDNDGNTALHLVVESGDIEMFSSLVKNLQVMLNLPNNNGQTPRDISRSKCPTSLYFGWNPQKVIHHSLEFVGAKYGCHRRDHFKENYAPQRDAHMDFGKIQDSTQTLGISSVLIATVTFGAAFAPPGGYIQDDHPNGGTPTLAGRHSFNAFIISNVLAFICSIMATISLMFSGIAMVDLQIRKHHFTRAVFFSSSSYSCLASAFASGLYMVLAPVAYDTAVAILLLISVFPVIVSVDLLQTLRLSMQLRDRLGRKIWVAMLYLLFALVRYELWPFPIICGWTILSSYYRGICVPY